MIVLKSVIKLPQSDIIAKLLLIKILQKFQSGLGMSNIFELNGAK